VLRESVVIIATYEDQDSRDLDLIYFNKDGLEYVPIFSSSEEFQRETEGTEYNYMGMTIDTKLLGAFIPDGITLIMDPLGKNPKVIEKNDLLGLRYE